MKLSGIFILFLSMTAAQLTSQVKSGPAPVERPNIVWITSEDNSKHYLSLFDEHGVETPHIAALAEEGLLFTHAFSNAPVCSVSRSTLITGCYAPRIGAQYHRKIKKVPMPVALKMFPQYLREAGYYTTNNSKEDYNLEKSDEVWDESSRTASWKNRNPGQPFFHVVNTTVTHEGNLHFDWKEMETNVLHTGVDEVFVMPNHPNTPLFRYTNAYYRDRIRLMDQKVGAVISELKKDGLIDNTIIFYFGDHGGVLPGSKGYLYETGLHIPLVIYVPAKYRESLGVEPGTKVTGFVSFVDFGPTVLHLAGIKVPSEMDGRPFLGTGIDSTEVNNRNIAYGYADRFDEKYDMVRSVRKGRYKYIRSFQPWNVDGLMNNYRYRQAAYREWDSLYRAGELNDVQSAFFEPRPPELLFDLESDPYETQNLAGRKKYRAVLIELREMLNEWMTAMPDLSFYPEYFLINEAFGNPVQFGREHREDIETYLSIANLCLRDDGSDQLLNALQSQDLWQRYWALNAATSGEGMLPLAKSISEIAEDDVIPVNRMQAAIFLAIKLGKDPSQVMVDALYAARYPAEGLLILNSIVLMRDWAMRLLPEGSPGVSFNIQPDKISPDIREAPEVQRRLKYLGLM